MCVCQTSSLNNLIWRLNEYPQDLHVKYSVCIMCLIFSLIHVFALFFFVVCMYVCSGLFWSWSRTAIDSWSERYAISPDYAGYLFLVLWTIFEHLYRPEYNAVKHYPSVLIGLFVYLRIFPLNSSFSTLGCTLKKILTSLVLFSQLIKVSETIKKYFIDIRVLRKLVDATFFKIWRGWQELKC